MFLTLILAFSLIGLVLLMHDEYRDKSTWMKIGEKLLDAIIAEK